MSPSTKKVDEPHSYQIVFKTNADYVRLLDHLGLTKDIEGDEEVLKYVKNPRLGSKGESSINFELVDYPGLLFQVTEKSTLNVFICWSNLKRLFEPILIVRDKILKPKDASERVYLIYKEGFPIGRAASYKYLKEMASYIAEHDRHLPDHAQRLFRLLIPEKNFVYALLTYEHGLELGAQLEKEDMIL